MDNVEKLELAAAIDDLRDDKEIIVCLTNRLRTSRFVEIFRTVVEDGRVVLEVDFEHEG